LVYGIKLDEPPSAFLATLLKAMSVVQIKRRFDFYALKGSLAELQTQLIIAQEIGYIDSVIFKDMDERCQMLGKMIGALIRARTPTSHP